MTAGELWWSRIANSVRFLNDVQAVLMNEGSVLMQFEEGIPWEEILLETLEQKLGYATDDRTFKQYDVSGEPDAGAFLKKKYIDTSPDNAYWPTTHGSPERYLAQDRTNTLNRRYVCLTGIRQAQAEMWRDSVTEYLRHCENGQEHGVFILLTEGSGSEKAESSLNAEEDGKTAEELLNVFRYAEYANDYDCMMLCLTQISELKCSKAEKLYLSEVASSIAHNRAEHASMLAAAEQKLLMDPVGTAREVFDSFGIKVTNLSKAVKAAVWEAQIKLVFPRVENFRADLINQYKDRLKKRLPIYGCNKQKIYDVWDLEIGELFFVCKGNNAGGVVPTAEFELLRKMRDARNKLAHWDTLRYEELKDLGVI